ncbi:hypothetical protein WAL17_24300 [Waltera acetigignens]
MSFHFHVFICSIATSHAKIEWNTSLVRKRGWFTLFLYRASRLIGRTPRAAEGPQADIGLRV